MAIQAHLPKRVGWPCLVRSALKRTPVQDFNSFSIMFCYIISTTYQKIGDLFCLDIFLDFRTVWPPHLFVCGPSPAVEKRALSYWLGPWSLPVSMYGRLRRGVDRRRRRRWLERRHYGGYGGYGPSRRAERRRYYTRAEGFAVCGCEKSTF